MAGLKAIGIGSTKAAIKQILNNAVYGSKDEGNYARSSQPAEAGRRNATSCKTGGQIAGKEELAYTFLCICLTNSGETAGKPCHKEVTNTYHWTTATTNMQQVWGDMRKLCPKSSKGKTTAAAIHAALTRVRAAIQYKSDAGYLGNKYSSDCDGTSANGLCVKYTGITASSIDAFHEIAWVKAYEEASEKLEKSTAAATQRYQLISMGNSSLNANPTTGYISPNSNWATCSRQYPGGNGSGFHQRERMQFSQKRNRMKKLKVAAITLREIRMAKSAH
uniref:Variant surface glycoprotein 1125.4289 n=1 Tax=Trypanosoma brucei TaxID=5691 RepID=A0A1J0RA66_9TRYP|nr:variant surface glycoprotein 1125.4289 [Trypanosoma brucei]